MPGDLRASRETASSHDDESCLTRAGLLSAILFRAKTAAMQNSEVLHNHPHARISLELLSFAIGAQLAYSAMTSAARCPSMNEQPISLHNEHQIRIGGSCSTHETARQAQKQFATASMHRVRI